MFDKFAGASQNLTTGFEADMTSRAKIAKHTLANLGQDTKKFTSQATSMSLGLNISAESAAQAIGAWERAQGALNATGLKGAKDLAKLSEVTGTNVSVLRDAGVQLSKLGASNKQIAGLMDVMAHMGEVTGDVGGALNSLPQIMERVQQRAALMGTELRPEDLVAYAKQEAIVAAGFGKMGKSADEARSLAAELTTALLGSQEGLQNMFGGTEEDLRPLARNLGVALGDINKGFELIKGGPQDFVTNLTGMVREAKKSGRMTADSFNFLRAQLKEALGPAADDLVNFMQTADDSTLEMMSTFEKASAGTVKRVADMHRTGYTLKDSMEMIKNSLVTSFRDIGRSQAETFVKDSRETYKKFGQQLHDISKKGGPLGVFVDKLSLAHQIGGLAFLPEGLRPYAALLGDMGKELVPLIPLLPMLVSSFAGLVPLLFGPGAILVGIGLLVGWFVKLRLEGKDTEQALTHMGSEIVGFLEKVPGYIGKAIEQVAEWAGAFAEMVEKIDWPEVGKKISTALRNVFDPSTASGAKIQGAWSIMLRNVGKLSEALTEGLAMAWDQIDWDKILGSDTLDNLIILKNIVLSIGAAVKTLVEWLFKLSGIGLVTKAMEVFPDIKDTLSQKYEELNIGLGTDVFKQSRDRFRAHSEMAKQASTSSSGIVERTPEMAALMAQLEADRKESNKIAAESLEVQKKSLKVAESKKTGLRAGQGAEVLGFGDAVAVDAGGES